nr:hypothetical protein [Streptomyces echinoruber]
MPAVLVIAARDDWPTDRVVKALTDGGAEVFRMDTGEFPQDLTLAGRIDARRGWSDGLATALRAVDLADITAVYYRAPNAFAFPPGMSGPEQRFAAAQARSGLGGIITALDCRWVSHPAAMSRAEYQPLQLATARACGLTVPPTLITNRADAVRAFVGDGGGRHRLAQRLRLAPPHRVTLAPARLTPFSGPARLFLPWRMGGALPGRSTKTVTETVTETGVSRAAAIRRKSLERGSIWPASMR